MAALWWLMGDVAVGNSEMEDFFEIGGITARIMFTVYRACPLLPLYSIYSWPYIVMALYSCGHI